MLKRIAALSLAGLLLLLSPVQANAGLFRKFVVAGAAFEGAEAVGIGLSFASLLDAVAEAPTDSPQYREALRQIVVLLARHPHIGPTILGHEADKLAARSPYQAAAVHRAANIAILESRRGDDGTRQGGYSRGQLLSQGGMGDPDDDNNHRFRRQNRGDQSINRREGDSKRAEQDTVDQAAKLAKIVDRDDFGRFIEDEKAANGRPNNFNFTMQELRELALEYKRSGGK